MAGYMEGVRGGIMREEGLAGMDQRTLEQRGIDVLARASAGEDLDVTVLAFAQWLSDMRSRSTASVQQMLAEMGIIRNGITSNNADLVEFKRNTATVQQQMQSQIIDLRDKLTDAYSEIANMKKSKAQFEQELTANYTSLAEQFHFRSMEQETLKKAYSQTHQQLQDQILSLQQEIHEMKTKFDENHRLEFVSNEQQHHRVAELDLNSQYVANELKRMRQDYDAAIATTTNGIQKWNDTVRELRQDFNDLKKLQQSSHKALQGQVWDVQHEARTGQGGAAKAAPSGPRALAAPQPGAMPPRGMAGGVAPAPAPGMPTPGGQSYTVPSGPYVVR